MSLIIEVLGGYKARDARLAAELAAAKANAITEAELIALNAAKTDLVATGDIAPTATVTPA